MDQVPKAADAIFKKLMELDHCVILFDEIDELIRVRDGASSDPFGRFLTTSMLPKLAKLWEQRRVLFFVNTNDIEVADPAIKRSQRFDAAVFVPPPSFEKKKLALDELLGYHQPGLTKKRVETALAEQGQRDVPLGVFALLRWDQIDDLAHRLSRRAAARAKKKATLLEVLEDLGKELERTDWKKSSTTESSGGKETSEEQSADPHPHQQMFARWRQQRLDERRDYRNRAVLEIERSARLPRGWKLYGSNGPDHRYVVLDSKVEDALDLDSKGALTLKGTNWVAVDRSGTLSFTVE
jgi:SpoVK/Ycf46/Vps4 family AAA+-type ATPase